LEFIQGPLYHFYLYPEHQPERLPEQDHLLTSQLMVVIIKLLVAIIKLLAIFATIK
jgi:hypothetical protein